MAAVTRFAEMRIPLSRNEGVSIAFVSIVPSFKTFRFVIAVTPGSVEASVSTQRRTIVLDRQKFHRLIV